MKMPKLAPKGMSLVEMLVASALTSLLFMVVASASVFSRYSLAALSNYCELQDQSRFALDRITREIRQAKAVTAFSPTAFTLRNGDGTTTQFTYNPDNATLVRTTGGRSEVLLQECNSLTFSNFQRNTVPGTYIQYPVTSTDTSKLIQLNWVCSRPVMGSRRNTECVQSAKVVIRVDTK